MTSTQPADTRILYRITFRSTESTETFTYEAGAHPLRSPRTVAHQLWHYHCQHGGPDIDLLNPVIENLGPVHDEAA